MTTFPLAVLAPSRAAAACTLLSRVAGSHAAATAGLRHAEDLVRPGKRCGRQHIDKNGQEKNTLAVNVREVRVLQVAGVAPSSGTAGRLGEGGLVTGEGMARRHGRNHEVMLHADAQRLLAEADYPARVKHTI
jgi:hypothetical protein